MLVLISVRLAGQNYQLDGRMHGFIGGNVFVKSCRAGPGCLVHAASLLLPVQQVLNRCPSNDELASREPADLYLAYLHVLIRTVFPDKCHSVGILPICCLMRMLRSLAIHVGYICTQCH